MSGSEMMHVKIELQRVKQTVIHQLWNSQEELQQIIKDELDEAFASDWILVTIRDCARMAVRQAIKKSIENSPLEELIKFHLKEVMTNEEKPSE